MLNLALSDYLEQVIESLEIEKHPYFLALREGQFSKEEFLRQQIDFSHAVKHFSAAMALVIAKIPEPKDRTQVVANLWEEHGSGKSEDLHVNTILKLVERLGGNSQSNTPISPEVRIFVQALKGAAVFEDYRFSAAMFGAIERSFVNISHLICEAIIKSEWLEQDRITHYALHEQIDIGHAEDFLKVCQADWDNPAHQAEIKNGIHFGARLFLNLYAGLLEIAKRNSGLKDQPHLAAESNRA